VGVAIGVRKAGLVIPIKSKPLGNKNSIKHGATTTFPNVVVVTLIKSKRFASMK
jgi:hypothetical protein